LRRDVIAMLVVIGVITVIASILIGFTIAGGHVFVLLQWAEFLTILGTAVGSVLIAIPFSLLKKVRSTICESFRAPHDTQSYMRLFKTIYELFLVGQRQGLREMERHIEDPDNSEIISQNRWLMQDEYFCSLFCDSMRILVMQALTPHEIETMINVRIDTFENESRPVIGVITKVADSLPGLGIVAAVLGIIVTMGSIDQGSEYVGRHVAAALVGTFIGVLMCYGFVSPLATKIEHFVDSKIRDFEAIKACVVAYAKGRSSSLAIEMARQAIPSEKRPGSLELERFLRERK
jgi:chemotaxis protein MotA